MNHQQVIQRIKRAAQKRNFSYLFDELTSIINDPDTHHNMAMVAGTAFAAAIDVGDLELVKETHRLYLVNCNPAPMLRDPWCLYRAAHRNKLDIVKYLMSVEPVSYMIPEIAYSGAIHNNIKMIKYALNNITDRDARLDLLWDRSGPLKSALSVGCIESARFLIAELKKLYPNASQSDFRSIMRSMAVFNYGMNCAKSAGHQHMVDFINNQLGVNNFFSKSTGMQVSAPHLTDRAMADIMSGYRR